MEATFANPESIKSWIDENSISREAQRFLAARAALRVLPHAWHDFLFEDWGQGHWDEPIHLIRAGLYSLSVTPASMDGDLTAAISDEAQAVGTFIHAQSSNTFAVGYALAFSCWGNLFGAADAASKVFGKTLRVVASDTTLCHELELLAASPLWQYHTSAEADESFDWHDFVDTNIDLWDDVKAYYRDRGNPNVYRFWLDWYQRALDGTETRWPLLRDIALLDKDETGEDLWQNPEKLSREIARLEQRYALDQVIAAHPHAWKIALDHATGLFAAEPVVALDLEEIIKDVGRSLRDLRTRCRQIKVANFGQAVELAFEPVIKILKRDVKDYRDAPYSLFKALEFARKEMEDIALKEGFAGESYITRLFEELDSHGEEICLAAPEVVEKLKAKAEYRYTVSGTSRKRMLATQTLALHVDSEGILKRTALWALVVLQDPEAIEADRKEAIYFCTSILPRAARAFLDDAAENEEPATVDPVSRRKRVLEAAEAISKLDNAKDALIELGGDVPALAENVQSILSSLP